MVDMSEIFGKSKSETKDERVLIEGIDGMCECFWPIAYGLYDPDTKKLTYVCLHPDEPHWTTIEIDLDA